MTRAEIWATNAPEFYLLLVDGGEVEVLLAQWMEAGIDFGHRRVQLCHAGVDQHARIGMIDDMHVHRHPAFPGEQVGNPDWRDGDRGAHVFW